MYSYPNITAFHIIILLSVGAPDTPVGGSSCNLLIKILSYHITHQNTQIDLKAMVLYAKKQTL